jgi:hypothetical protein
VLDSSPTIRGRHSAGIAVEAQQGSHEIGYDERRLRDAFGQLARGLAALRARFFGREPPRGERGGQRLAPSPGHARSSPSYFGALSIRSAAICIGSPFTPRSSTFLR